MSDVKKLEDARANLVVKRRQLAGVAASGEASSEIALAIKALQDGIEAVDRAIADEQRLTQKRPGAVV